MLRRFSLFLCVLLGAAVPAQAQIQTAAKHALLMDAATGQVLWEKEGLVPNPPASMSKLMTLDLLFGRLKDGRVKLTDTFPVSERAWRTGGSRMFLDVGTRVSVENLIRGIIIQSGNDACVVVAEALGGSVEGFADMMNARAKQIGLNQSHFVNPDGLPEPPGQMMSALDLAKLSRHLITEYAQYYPYFSEREFTWNKIRQPNRDLVLGMLQGADGLKTGHTDAAGYGIVVSAKRGDQRLILVLNGLRFPQYKNDYFPNIRRAEEAVRVMEMAFREFRSYSVLKTNQIVGTLPVLEGAQPTVSVTHAKALNVTMQVESSKGIKTQLRPNPGLTAPISVGQRVGTLRVTAPDFPPLDVPVFAAEAVAKVGVIGGMWNSVKRKIWK
jgi:D-alanyl-D-alanine carboxypeptidase (penicillin-binding protein 5/6)